MPREIEFYERDGVQLAGVHYGNKVYVASCEDVLIFCEDVSSQIKAHLTKRSPDYKLAVVNCPRCHCIFDLELPAKSG